MPLQALFALQDEILEERLDTLLPQVMAEANIDMWIIIGDEYNEGPLLRSLLPSSFFHARRRSLFIFARDGGSEGGGSSAGDGGSEGGRASVGDRRSGARGGLRRYIVSKPDFSIDRFYEPVLLKPPDFDFETFYSTFAGDYDLDAIRAMETEDTWECVARLVRRHDPVRISVQTSRTTAFADGLSKSNYDLLAAAIGPDYEERLVSGEEPTIHWLETRTPREIELFATVVAATRGIIRELYSTAVIRPGRTTLGEARFFMMERGQQMGMSPWFEATLWARRRGAAHIDDDDAVIRPGDLLHCDVGFCYGGLCSDVQEMAYVDDPESPDNDRVRKALSDLHAEAAQLLDILAGEFRSGATGNQILASALAKGREAGITRPMIYSHPTGPFGHGPGPTIGSFTNQNFVDGMGEYRIRENTSYALELNVRKELRPWDDLVVMYGQEIDVVYRGGRVEYPAGRQERLHVIG
jgi:Xaa-Pro aminopeptidase